MIDYIIVCYRDLQDLYSVRTLRGDDCWNDHCLVRATLALKIRPKARRANFPRPNQLDVSKLYSPKTKSIFDELLKSMKNFKVSYKSACEKFKASCGLERQTRHNLKQTQKKKFEIVL